MWATRHVCPWSLPSVYGVVKGSLASGIGSTRSATRAPDTRVCCRASKHREGLRTAHTLALHSPPPHWRGSLALRSRPYAVAMRNTADQDSTSCYNWLRTQITATIERPKGSVEPSGL